MNTAKLKFNGSLNNILIYVDGKILKTKKGKYGGREAIIQTESPSLHLQIFNYLDMNESFWLLKQLFYFIISIFGIFDIFESRRSMSVFLDANLNLTEECNFTIRLNTPKKDQEYAKIESENEVQINNNICFVNERVKKRIKIFRIIKIMLYIALIASIILLLIF